MYMNLVYSVKNNFEFNAKERKDFIIVTFLFGFLLSFKEWGGAEFDIVAGMLNFLKYSIIVSVSLLVHILAMKAYGIKSGYKVEYSKWTTGLFITTFLTIMTNGAFNIFLPFGMITIDTIARLRMGQPQPELGYKDLAKIGFIGIVSNLFLAAVGKLLFPIIPDFAKDFFFLNLVFAVVMLLPFPPLHGFHILYNPVRWYFGLFVSFALVYISAIVFLPFIWALLIALVFSVIGMLGFNKLLNEHNL